MWRLTGAATAVWLMAGAASNGAAFQPCSVDAMVVFDGSASMAERGDAVFATTRIADARAAMRRAMPQIAQLRRVGLIVYGPDGTPGDGPGEHPSQSIGCRSVDVRFAPRAQAADALIRAVEDVLPGGSTPLTAGVAEAAKVLDHKATPGIVVLVTDGKETCGGLPCAVADQLAQESADLTVHVVGFRVRSEYFDWNTGQGADHQEVPILARCLADRTGGTYTTAETVADLVSALDATLGCAVFGRMVREITHPTG